jgi:hypothetical protein
VGCHDHEATCRARKCPSKNEGFAQWERKTREGRATDRDTKTQGGEAQAAIKRFVAEQNADPKPFTWTADPDRIIAAVRRGHQTLDSILCRALSEALQLS